MVGHRASKRLRPARRKALAIAQAVALCAAAGCSSEEEACQTTPGARSFADAAGKYRGCCWPNETPYNSATCCTLSGFVWTGTSCLAFTTGPFVPPAMA